MDFTNPNLVEEAGEVMVMVKEVKMEHIKATGETEQKN
jgi:hypothetical protein